MKNESRRKSNSRQALLNIYYNVPFSCRILGTGVTGRLYAPYPRPRFGFGSLKARYKFMYLLTNFRSKLGRYIQDIRDKNVRVVKDKFLFQKYTRLHSFKYDFPNIFWGEAHREWRIYPLAKKFVFHHRKKLAPVAYNRNFHQTKLPGYATT